MKTIICLMLAVVLLGGVCQAQTNESADLALSNVMSNASNLLAQIAAAKAGSAASISPASIGNYTDIAMKLIEAIGGLAAAIFTLARILRKAIPDTFQTGGAGTLLKHISLEINPQLTPTPPNVPVPSVELKDTTTGATIVPEAVNSPK